VALPRLIRDTQGSTDLPELKADAPAATRATLAILYAETRGFTRMSEILEPDVVLTRIAEFFTLVAASVGRHEGAVRNVLNDNLVATFAGEANAQRAVQTAQEVQREFTSLEEAWQRDYGFRTAVAMGLHSGEAVVGALSGALDGQALVIGDGLSVAERLLHRARAGEFILSKAMMDALASTGFALEVEELPALTISKREPIQIYGVLLDTRLDFTD
jgi:adenylate cyclase